MELQRLGSVELLVMVAVALPRVQVESQLAHVAHPLDVPQSGGVTGAVLVAVWDQQQVGAVALVVTVGSQWAVGRPVLPVVAPQPDSERNVGVGGEGGAGVAVPVHWHVMGGWMGYEVPAGDHRWSPLELVELVQARGQPQTNGTRVGDWCHRDCHAARRLSQSHGSRWQQGHDGGDGSTPL